MDEIQQQAINIMRRDVGVWDSRWEFLDGEGNVASTANGIQTMKFVIDDAVMQIMMEVPDLHQQSVTHRFYKSDIQVLYWISVDNKGDLWTFVEDFRNNVSESLPHENADGTTTWLRFKTIREADDEMDVLMELSSDEKVWTPIFRQYRVRRVD